MMTMAAESNPLQLNAFEPVIVHSLDKSIFPLRAACLTLTKRCVRGIANQAELCTSVEQSIGLVTALDPYIGYTVEHSTQEAQTIEQGVAELYSITSCQVQVSWLLY